MELLLQLSTSKLFLKTNKTGLVCFLVFANLTFLKGTGMAYFQVNSGDENFFYNGTLVANDGSLLEWPLPLGQNQVSFRFGVKEFFLNFKC